LSILTPKYNTSSREAVNLKGSLPVRSIEEIKRRIADTDEGALVFVSDVWADRATVTIPAGKKFDFAGNNFKTDILFVVESGASVQFSSVIFTSALSGAGSITATDCEFADIAFTGNIDGVKTSGCSFGTTLTAGTCSNSEISGTTGGADEVLLCGPLVETKIDLAGGLDSSTNPVDCNINITGDWVNAPAGGTGCNIFARNFTSTSAPIPAAFVADGDYGDVTVSGSGTAWSIDAQAVTNAKFRNSVAVSVVGRASGTTGSVADIVAGGSNQVLRRVGTTLGFGSIPESTVDNLVTDLADRVVGPASSTDNAITRFDGTTGKLIQNSSVTLDDNGLFAWAASTNGQMDCDKTITLNSDKGASNSDLLSVQRNGIQTAVVRAAGELVVGRNSANILLSDHLKTNRFGWDSESTTYITHPSALNVLDIYSAGTLTARFNDVQILANQDDPTTPAYSFQEAANTGVTLNSAATKLLLVNNSETIATVDAGGFQVTSSLGASDIIGNGFINQFAVGDAIYSFFGDTDTGMLRWAANEIGWNVGGNTKMILADSELNVLGNVKRNSTSSTSDANLTVDAATTGIATWVASFTAARTLQVSNMIAGRSIKILMRNTNATARVITIQASATTSGYANVICTGNTAGAASVSTVSLVATSGTAIVEIFATAGGIFGRLG